MRHLPTLIPTDVWFRVALFFVICMGVTIWFLFQKAEAANGEWFKYLGYLFAFLAVITATDVYLRRGYRVSYDENAVYWRKVGLRGRFAKTVTMPFDTITEVLAETGSLGIKPFEAAVLRAGMHDIPDIILSRLYLRVEDIQDILVAVSTRANAAMESEVRKLWE